MSKSSLRLGTILNILILLIGSSNFAFADSNQFITYQGRILRPDGSPLSGNIEFNIKIYSPTPSSCLLWSETQTVSMKEAAKGAFSLQIGRNSNRITGANGGAASTFNQVFINNPSLTINASHCDSGSTYTPNLNDDRALSVTFSDQGQNVKVVDLPIKSVPFAMQAEQIGGYSINYLFKIAGMAQAGDKNTGLFARDAMNILWELSHNQSMSGNRLQNVGTPTAATDAATKAYVDSLTGAVGTTAISNISADAPLAVASSGTTRIISLGTVGTAGTYGSPVLVPQITVDAWGRITLAENKAIPMASTSAPGLVQVDTSTGLTISGGTLGLTLPTLGGANFGSQAQRTVLAAPTGAAGNPSFRLLDEVDIPTLTAAGKVANSATTATSANTANAILARDASGNFVANNATLNSVSLDNGSGLSVILKTPVALTPYTLTLPQNQGNANDILAVDALGNLVWTSMSGAGSVTGVDLSLPSELTVTSAPITAGAGTLSASWASQNQNLVFASPTGSAGTPSFRALAPSDIPSLDASIIASGTLGVNRGGTGLDASSAADGQLLIGNGSGFSLNTLTAGSGISITNSAGSISISSTLAGGTVTNVGLTAPTSVFTVANSPVVGAGTMDITLNSQAAATVFAAPTGSAGVPSFRALAGTDLPVLAGTGVTLSTGSGSLIISAAGSGGTLTEVTAGTGLLGGSITSAGTLSVDVGLTDGKIVQVGTGDKIPVALIPNLDASILTSGTLGVDRGGTGLVPVVGDANKLYGIDATGAAAEFKSLIAGTGVSIDMSVPGSISISAAGSGGTVTNIGALVPSYMTVSPAVITSSGTFDFSFNSQNAAMVFASPTGASGAPSFRALAASDIPSLDASKIGSGTLGIDRGGTGLVPVVGDANKVYGINAAGTASEFKSLIAGTGVSVDLSTPGQISISSTLAGGTVTEVTAGTGLLGGSITGAGTVSVDVGITDGKIVQVGAGDKIPVSLIPNLDTGILVSGTLGVNRGGTGLVPAAGDANKVYGINAAGDNGEYKSIVAGTGVTVDLSTPGQIGISSTGLGGTVFNIGAVVPSYMTVTPAAITSSGTFDFSFNSQNAAMVFASPTGASGAPSFRALAASDIPSLDASKIGSGTLSVDRGGTGLVPVVGDANKVYGINAAGTASEFKSLVAGTGVSVDLSTPGQISISSTLAGGTVTEVTAGTGLLGGSITGAGTVSVDVGITDGKIVQVGVGDKIPVSLIPNLDTGILVSGTLSVNRGGTGLVPAAGDANKVYGINAAGDNGEYKSIVAGTGVTVDLSTPGQIGISALGSGGTVTNIGAIVPSYMSVSPAAITSSGTFDFSFNSQNAAMIFASPTGASGAPSFRALAGTDLPVLAGTGVTLSMGSGSLIISAAGSGGTVTEVTAGTGLLGGSITGAGTVSVDVGITDGKIVQVGTGDKIPVSLIPSLDTAILTSGTLSVNRGGTGLVPAAGDANKVYGINAAGDNGEYKSVVAGTGVTVDLSTPGQISISATGSGGTVTHVGLTAPTSVFTVANSPVTGAGTMDISLNSQVGSTVFAAPVGASGVPSFRSLVASDIPALDISKLTSGTLGTQFGGTGLDASAAANGQLLIGNGSGFTLNTLTAGSGINITNTAGSISISSTLAGGTVTEIGATVPSYMNVSPASITSSGTFDFSFNSQNAAMIFASPTGASGAPTFRALAASDIPSLDASKIGSGTLGIDRGGTGLVPVVGDANKVYGINAAGTASEFKSLIAGTGVTVDLSTAGQISISATGSGGTVTEIGATVPSYMNVSPASITSNGTFDFSFNTQSAAMIFASPTGASGAPTFRALTASDIPGLDTAKLTSGTLPVSRGGTGLGSFTPYAIMAANMTGDAIEQRTCSAGEVLVWQVATGWTCEAKSSGSVSSVDMSMPSIFNVAGGPVTSIGTFNVSLQSQAANTVFAAPTGGSGTPTFRALASSDIPGLDVSKLVSGTLGVNRGGTGLDASAAADGQLLIGNGSGFTLNTLTAGSGINITNSAGSISISSTLAGGTVTNIGLTAPTSVFTVANSPVTGAGTMDISLNSQAAASVFAAPTGASGTPTFRSLASTDIPGLDASKITSGTLGVNRGGTGLVPMAGNANQLYGIDSTGLAAEFKTLVAGTGLSITHSAGTISLSVGSSGVGQWLDNSQGIHYSAGSVGIGTSTPSSKLEVAGEIRVANGTQTLPSYSFTTDSDSGFFSVGNNVIGISTGNNHMFSFTNSALKSPTSGGAEVGSGIGTFAGPTYSFSGSYGLGMYRPAADSLAFATSSAERLRITSGGSVGIGTATPETIFHVAKSSGSLPAVNANDIATFQHNASSTQDAGLRVITGETGVGYLGFGTATNRDAAGIAFGNNASDQSLYLNINASPKLVLRSNSNVGIGTSTPTTGLDIATTGTLGSAIRIPRDSTANRPSGLTGMMRYNTDLNKYEVYEAASGWASLSTGSIASSQWTNIAKGIHYSSGSVGIGTSTPTANLDVAGSLAASGDIYLPGATFWAGSRANIELTNGADFYTNNINDTIVFNTLTIADREISIRTNQAGGGGTVKMGAWSPITADSVLDWEGATLAIQGGASTGTEMGGPITFLTSGTGASSGVTANPLAEKMRIDGSGKVGIGTASPSVRLDIAATGTDSAIRIPRDTTANRPVGAAAADLQGMMRYNTTLNKYEVYEGTTGWASLASGAVGTGDFKADGSVPMTGNLRLNGRWLSNDGDSEGISVLNSGIVIAGTSTSNPALTNNPAFIVSRGNAEAPPYLEFLHYGRDTAMIGIAADAYFTMASENSTNGIKFKTNGVWGAAQYIDGSTTAMTILNSGKVGIGTETPTTILDVASNGTAGSAIRIPRDTTANRPSSPGVGMIRYNTTDNKYEVYETAGWASLSTSSGTAGISQWANNSQGINYSAGSVGIGTASPTATLDVNGSIATGLYYSTDSYNELYLDSSSMTIGRDGDSKFEFFAGGADITGTSGSQGELRLNKGGSVTASNQSLGSLYFGSSTGSNGAAINGSSSQVWSGSARGTNLKFSTIANDTTTLVDRMFISQNGNIGIGTITPTTRLDIAATGTLGSAIRIPRDTTANRPVGSAAADLQGMMRYNTSLNKYEVYEGTTGWSSLTTGSVASSQWSNVTNGIAYTTGSVGIGTSTPYAQLEIRGPNPTFNIASSTTGIGGALAGGVAFKDNSNMDAGFIGYSWADDLRISNRNGISFGSNTNSYLMHMTKEGRLGIGTTGPMAALDVAVAGTGSAIRIPRDTTANRPTSWTGDDLIGMMRYNTTLSKYEVYETTGWASLTTGSVASSQWTTLSNGIAYTGGGSVGINTTTPLGALQVRDGGAATQITVGPSTQSSANAVLALQAKNSGSTNEATLTANWTGELQLQPQWGQDTAIYSQGAPIFTAKANGSMGVGTQSPSARFHVAGSTDMGDFGSLTVANNVFRVSEGASYLAMDGNSIVTNSPLNIGNTVNQSLFLATNNTSRLEINGSGRIYTSGPSMTLGSTTAYTGAALAVDSTGTMSSVLLPRASTASRPSGVNGMIRYNSSTNKFEAYENSAWTNMIGSSGGASAWKTTPNGTDIATQTPVYVGINMPAATDPEAPLDVRGNAKITGWATFLDGFEFGDGTTAHAHQIATASGGYSTTRFNGNYGGAFWQWGTGGTTAAEIGLQGHQNFFAIYNTNAGDLSWPYVDIALASNGGDSWIRDGRFAIGTDVPQANLHVNEIQDTTSMYPLAVTQGSLASGNKTQIYLGKDTSTGVYMSYNHNTTAANRSMGLGMINGSSDIMTLKNNGYVGVGTTNPLVHFTVAGTYGADAAMTVNSTNNTSGTGATLYLQNYGTVGNGQVQINQHRGTFSSPTAVQAGDWLGMLQFQGFGGTSYSGRASIVAIATQTYTDSAGGSAMGFTTTAANTNTEAERMRITPEGYVGIGITAPSHILHINGQGRATNSAWATTSDIRLKDIDGDYTNGLEQILKLHTVKFHYKKNNPLSLPSDKAFYGIIAQELQTAIPEAVEQTADGYLTVNTDPVNWAMVNAIQDLHGLCKASEDQLARIDTQLKAHSRDIASLKEDAAQKDIEIQDLKRQNQLLKEAVCEINPKAKLCQD